MTETSASSHSKAISGIRWIGASKVLVQVVTWSLTVFSVRLLTPTDYGIVSMSGLVTILTGLILDGGLAVGLVQRKEVDREILSNALIALLLGSLVTVLLVQFSAGSVAAFFSEPALENVLRVACLQFPIGALTVVPSAMLSRQMSFRPIALSQAASSISQVLITFVLAYLQFGYWALVYAAVLSSVVRLIFLWSYARPPITFYPRLAVLRPFLSQSMYLIGQRSLWFWVQEADTFVIGRILGAAPLGSYSIAKILANAPLERAAEVINQVSLPSFAATQDDRAAWLAGFKNLVQISAVVSFPLFWGMATVAHNVLPLILGSRWQGSIIPFTILCLILPLRTTFSLADAAVLGSGRADIAFLNVAVWALVLTPLLFVGAHFGILGIALAWLVGFPIVFLIFLNRISKTFDVRISAVCRPMVYPALGSICGALSSVAVSILMAPLGAPLIVFALQVPTFAVVYVVVLRLADHEALKSFIGLVAKLIGRGR